LINKKGAAKSAPKKSSTKQIEPALLDLFTDEIKDIYWAEENW
jgi:hypothetical protein